MQIHSRYFSKELQDLYKLHDKIDDDDYVYCETQLGMYGLRQADILTYILTKKRLQPAGYYPIKESNGIWKYKTSKTMFFVIC